MSSHAFSQLQERGFIYQVTDEQEVPRLLDNSVVTFYVGFDATADSLHAGNLLPIMAMRRLQRCGHRPIALLGGGTTLIGDPSGKTEMRKMLDRETVAANAARFQAQLARYLDFGPGQATLVNNIDWLGPLNYIEFLRDVGRHFSVNKMLQADSVRLRLETGLSFIEFNYMLLQAYDFAVLCRQHDCDFQLGGQDQWGNITAGTDLVRRMLNRQAYGATFPLLTDSNGKKFGKSEAGAIWLDGAKTPPFAYYQFWRNCQDADVTRLLLLFTDLPADECRRLGTLPAPGLNRAKEILAYEATALTHGTAAAQEAYAAAGQQFGFADPAGQIPTSSALKDVRVAVKADLPTVTLAAADLEGLQAAKLFVLAGLADSNGAARRLIQGGGAYLNEERVSDFARPVTAADFKDGALLLRAGKKNIKRLVLE